MARRKDALNEEVTAGPDDAMTADAVTPPDPLPVPEPPPVVLPPIPASPLPPRRSGVLGPLLGGAIAAAGGYALAHYNVLGLAAPDQSAEVAAQVATLTDRLAALEARAPAPDEALRAEVAALADRLTALEAVPLPAAPDLSGLEARLAAIEALPAEGDASTAALAAKLAELERRLSAQPAVDQAAIDAALARLEAAEAAAQDRADQATAAAEAAAQEAALTQVRDKALSGQGFEAELAALADPDLQAALAPHSAGIPTLEDLQAGFPEAARQALQLDRAAASGDGWGARVLDFLAAQTGARSVTPREGTEPDAILSRAEFALGEGRLADAVAEVRTLDPGLQAPFADWLAQADARLAVLAALEGK